MMRKLWLIGIAVLVLVGLIGTSRGVGAVDIGSTIRPAVGFEGLVALVRSESFDRGAVVLVDPTRSTLQRDLPPHHPMLTLPMAAVKSGKPDGFATDDQSVGVWELANTRIEFSSSAGEGSLRPVRTAQSITHPRSAEEWRDVKWIVSMDRLVGQGLGAIRSDLMTSTDMRSSIVTSRVSLGAGTIEATEPEAPWNQNEQRFLVLKGLTPGRPVQQAATQRFVYKPEPVSTFRIILKSADGSTREIELKPTSNEIPIAISNHSTMDTLLNHEFPHQAVHFMAFYDLLATPAKTPVIPTSMVPYPSTYTAASPGYFCMGDPPMFTWSFENQ